MADKLNELFGELRAHERAEAPSFEDVLLRRRRPSARARHVMVSAAMVAAVALLLFWPRHTGDDLGTLSITNWRAPTDALLDVPGRELLTDLPVLHESVLDMGGTP